MGAARHRAPWFIGRGHDAAIWKLYVRRPLARSQKHCGEKSYIQIAGGSNGLYNSDAIAPTRPAMLVEGDLVTPVATGTTGARRARWIALLSCAPVVLVSYDNDAAGEQAARLARCARTPRGALARSGMTPPRCWPTTASFAPGSKPGFRSLLIRLNRHH